MKKLKIDREHHLFGRIKTVLVDGKEHDFVMAAYGSAKMFSEKGTKGEIVITSDEPASAIRRPVVEGEFELEGLICKRITAHIHLTLSNDRCLWCGNNSVAYSRVSESLLCKSCKKDNGDIHAN